MSDSARFEQFQLSFGWSEQRVCLECGEKFISCFLPPWFVPDYNTRKFYSVRFCSQRCANNGLEKFDREDEKRIRDRKSWG